MKNDPNEIGTLIHHKLLDGDIFIEEGFWVILKARSPIKDEIEDRRKKDSIHLMKHLEKLRMKAYNYTKEHDTKVYEKFCRDEITLQNRRISISVKATVFKTMENW